MKFRITRAAERGLKDIGWLQSNLSLSFGSYADPERTGFGLLRVFNDDVVTPGQGFGIHPQGERAKPECPRQYWSLRN
jgi:redox-sensitive bicupin YhaK (pirin superfamily)